MPFLDTAIRHIKNTAQVPSFSTYEERLHPYINNLFSNLPGVKKIEVPGNNLIYQLRNSGSDKTLALAAHLDKINHYGKVFPDKLPVTVMDDYIEGAMDDCAGLGILLTIAEKTSQLKTKPNLLFFFSEMEESKGLKEHPELLRNNGKGYKHGMGARQISQTCIKNNIIPDEIVTIDTTPLFKGKQGIALYSKHWELTDLKPTKKLVEQTLEVTKRFKSIYPDMLLENNTNDFLHYGYEFNKTSDQTVVSIALEPAIYPYHQKEERVFIDDIRQVLNILFQYIGQAN